MTDITGKYTLVLGLEIHLHVKTGQKMFCACSTEDIYGADPNTHVCPVCLGLPGALPVPNKESVEKTLSLGLVLGCKINRDSRFDRKHYFYPDLPKGYQISQYKQPLCEGGHVELPNGHVVELERIHLEEDTAKSMHVQGKTLLDFNKSGISLIEMVTKPCIHSVEDAVLYAKQVQEIVRYLNVGDANMELGQLRVEPNISLQTPEEKAQDVLPQYKVEVKNINSFRFLEKAIVYEIRRQRDLLDRGELPLQENRGYDEKRNITVPQRSKEEAKDYRYFPEPDIPPMHFSEEELQDLSSKLPELPLKVKRNLMREFNATYAEASVLFDLQLDRKVRALSERGLDTREAVKLLVNRAEMRGKSVEEIIAWVNARKSDRLASADTLLPLVAKVIQENPQVLAKIRSGDLGPLEFLLGQVMRLSRGKADPVLTRDLLKRELEV